MFNREQIIEKLSVRYHHYLKGLLYNDCAYMAGGEEGRRKFLPNLYIYYSRLPLPKGKNDKRFATDYVTPAALEILKKCKSNSNLRGVQYEHIVPKSKYIIRVCEQRAEKNELTIADIRELLLRYLWTATVTNEEHKRLSRTSMPAGWDQVNIMARYEEAVIELLPHDKAYLYNK